MKKVFSLLLVVCLLGAATLMAGCGQTGSSDAKSSGQRVLRVGMDASYPPFGSQNQETKDYEGFDVDIIRAIGLHDWAGVVLPVVALLNFLVFIWPAIDAFIQRRKYRHAPQTVNFKKAVRQQQQQKGYHHKCAVCGRTDTDYPDLQFRYCSKCVGYHCFCQDHIFNHVHFTEE